MRVLISGAGGLVGRSLASALEREGHTVTRLVRSAPRGGLEFRWDPAAGVLDPEALTGCDAVVHLAGAGIADGRWTPRRKAEILESRRLGTRLIASAITRTAAPPRVFICASAVGYYGDRGDEVLSEASGPGTGFLADVVRVWEEEARGAARPGVRVVHLRMGLVLAAGGGALQRMALPFRLGLGGPIGGGRQWMSWIGLRDLVRVFGHVLADGGIAGPVNAVSPGALTNLDFARALGRVLGRPAFLPVPAWALRVALGEMGRELMLFSQRVTPARLMASGFVVERPGIDQALGSALRSGAESD